MSAEHRTALVEQLIAPTEAAGLVSGGALYVMADGNATIDSGGMFRYYPTTSVECAITVRGRATHASGWAGVNHYDFAKIDPAALAQRALAKAQASANPQAVEPGRYTTILEPQATADLFSILVGRGQFDRGSLGRSDAEMGITAFAGAQLGWTKISERVLDPRLVMSADPMDPDGGFIPYDRYSGMPYRPVAWIDRGILRELAYDQQYALSALGSDQALLDPGSFRLTAAPGVPTVSLDDMIANTSRGILVTRLSGVTQLDLKTVLCTGYTRDGLWLIEHGKISKAIKNFRFTESPLFILNRLLDVGPSVRVYQPGRAWVAPAIRVDDFSFTALADAV
jgi:predicted Zn-dependent protease